MDEKLYQFTFKQDLDVDPKWGVQAIIYSDSGQNETLKGQMQN